MKKNRSGPSGKNNNIYIKVRVSLQERTEWMLLARSMGLCGSDMIRNLVTDHLNRLLKKKNRN